MDSPLQMSDTGHFQTGQILANRQEYGDRYARLRFVSASQAQEASLLRREILESLAGKTETGCLGTKIDCRNMSPGCRICTEGDWSCLFINNRCNCSCFYCPAPQDTTGEPATNSLTFPNAEDYADYVERFGFRGVSISGGEPLLTLDRTLKYLKAVKKRFGSRIYFWLYTNGVLASGDTLAKLKDAGLDEIRFDIGATDNSLKMLKNAVGIIPCVTVEIPAVPEEYELMKGKLVEMRDAGVNHLNLHQLRLTPYNFEHLAGRDYTFVHGEKVTVLESELTALKLLSFSVEKGIGLSVNYCSFVFKNRFQRRASRRRAALPMLAGHESITENGYIRTLVLKGPAEKIEAATARMKEKGSDPGRWRRDGSDALIFHPSLLPIADAESGMLFADYSSAAFVPHVTYRNPFKEVVLNRNRKIVIERTVQKRGVGMLPEDLLLLEENLQGGGNTEAAAPPRDAAIYEITPRGMQPYF